MVARKVRTHEARIFLRTYHYIIKFDNDPPVTIFLATMRHYNKYLKTLKVRPPKYFRSELFKLLAETVDDLE